MDQFDQKRPAEMQSSPPAYSELANNAFSSGIGKTPAIKKNDSKPYDRIAGENLPCVVPQTTTRLNRKPYYPFVRANAFGIQGYGISKDDFISFIDGLNACLVPNFTSAVTQEILTRHRKAKRSQRRSSAGEEKLTDGEHDDDPQANLLQYLHTTNEDFFHPAGLHVDVQTTEQMMSTVNVSESETQMPTLKHHSDVDAIITQQRRDSNAEDPRIRRLTDLEDYIMPLDFDVSATPRTDALLRRMNTNRAARSSQRQEKNTTRENVKLLKHEAKIEDRNAKLESELARLEEKMAANERQLKIDLARYDAKHHDKIKRDYEKEKEKLNRKAEEKVAKTDSRIEKRNSKLSQRQSSTEASKTSDMVQWIVIVPRHADHDLPDKT